jgi:hypothetical protein
MINMQELDVQQTILIVVGSDVKPEEKDRPIAYKLKANIEQSPKYGSLAFRKCIVISDALFDSDKIIQLCPTISIGGPGVNALSALLAEKLPIYLKKDDRYFIQFDETPQNNRISLWGMDQQSTEEAVNCFISEGLLDKYLNKVWN